MEKNQKLIILIIAQTTDEVPARESGDVFEIFDLERGLVCRGQHQKTGVCQGKSKLKMKLQKMLDFILLIVYKIVLCRS